ncbi:MAG: hypothetical protein ACTSWY_06025 [Promethearchaeota archaeon]
MGFNGRKKNQAFIFFTAFSILLIGCSYKLPEANAFTFHSVVIESFSPNQTYSYNINISKSNYVYYNIRTENSHFIINITIVSDGSLGNFLDSKTGPNAEYYYYTGEIYISNLSEQPTEYNITITNNGISEDILSFTLKLYDKTPAHITQIKEDLNLLPGQITGLVIIAILLILIIISRKISKIQPPSRRKLMLKRYSIANIAFIIFLFLGEFILFMGANPQAINSDCYEANFKKGGYIFNFPVFDTDHITIIFQWSKEYEPDDMGEYTKTIELVNSNDDNYLLSIIHDCSDSLNGKITNYSKIVVPAGRYSILGGEDITWNYANPISERDLTQFSIFIFTIDNLILILLFLYYATIFKFKRKLHT